MLHRWFPWKRLISRVARASGFIDPIALLARLEGFGQPAEIRNPLELLRAGVVFHARGLLNTGAIQHNLDWIWPYWVERQYNPQDESFIPRAFSVTHINLTNRNWTAIGLPGFDELPIVDPRGLVTPFWDSWSIDAWLLTDQGETLYPSRLGTVRQVLEIEEQLTVKTEARAPGMQLVSRAAVRLSDNGPACVIELAAGAAGPGWLVLSLRPYNPEGVSLVHAVSLLPDRSGWAVEGGRTVVFSRPPERYCFSYYRQGDVKNRLFTAPEEPEVFCRVGMATAAALFRVTGPTTVKAVIPLTSGKAQTGASVPSTWTEALEGAARLVVPDPLFQSLYETAVRSLVLHSPLEIYPGPFTYKRFWFRDAVFILHALLSAGFIARAGRLLDSFPGRQSAGGFFHSQQGEWDSNGEVLWIFQRYCQLSGEGPREAWGAAIRRGADWIVRKRLPADSGLPHAGLLPAGFSAEHLGPNDFYYWDDFWSVAGLRAAADWLKRAGDLSRAARYRREADHLWHCIEESLVSAGHSLARPGMPASPYRRMDPGAIGSLAAGYPLQLMAADDPRLLATVDFLLENCTVRDCFFQDMIHSGINAYLTLHMAQVLLRAADPRSLALFRRVAELASPTGQWPEAIHPRTLGGCMGDGHHVWASAEWVVMQRNCFVREEGEGLVLGGGIFPEWLDQPKPLSYGPAPTPFGPITIRIGAGADGIRVDWEAKWRGREPDLSIRLPHLPAVFPPPGSSTATVQRGTCK